MRFNGSLRSTFCCLKLSSCHGPLAPFPVTVFRLTRWAFTFDVWRHSSWDFVTIGNTEYERDLRSNEHYLSSESRILGSCTGLNYFLRPYFHNCTSSVHYCKDLFHIHTFIRSSNIWLSYIHSHLLVTLLFYSQTPSTKLFPCLTQLIIVVRTSQLFEVTEVHT